LVFENAWQWRKVNLGDSQNQLNLILGDKKSTRQTQRQEESLRQVFLTFLRNAEFQNRFFGTQGFQTTNKKQPNSRRLEADFVRQMLPVRK